MRGLAQVSFRGDLILKDIKPTLAGFLFVILDDLGDPSAVFLLVQHCPKLHISIDLP